MYTGGVESDSNGDDELRETPEEREARLKEEEEENKKAKKWNWFQYIYSLAKGDITKIEEITKLNFIFSLNFKAFEIENKKIYEYYNNK